jgi:hypothetical protein
MQRPATPLQSPFPKIATIQLVAPPHNRAVRSASALASPAALEKRPARIGPDPPVRGFAVTSCMGSPFGRVLHHPPVLHQSLCVLSEFRFIGGVSPCSQHRIISARARQRYHCRKQTSRE